MNFDRIESLFWKVFGSSDINYLEAVKELDKVDITFEEALFVNYLNQRKKNGFLNEPFDGKEFDRYCAELSVIDSLDVQYNFDKLNICRAINKKPDTRLTERCKRIVEIRGIREIDDLSNRYLDKLPENEAKAVMIVNEFYSKNLKTRIERGPVAIKKF